MDVVLMILAVVCACVGVVGSVLPALPGPPVSYVALLLLAFCNDVEISSATLLVNAILTIAITLFDYFAPAWCTNVAGGSKSAVNGATIGMLVGLFFGPLGIIFGPFVGAFLGELKNNTSQAAAFKVAFVSLGSFFLTTGIKLLYTLLLLSWIFVKLLALLFE